MSKEAQDKTGLEHICKDCLDYYEDLVLETREPCYVLVILETD